MDLGKSTGGEDVVVKMSVWTYTQSASLVHAATRLVEHLPPDGVERPFVEY